MMSTKLYIYILMMLMAVSSCHRPSYFKEKVEEHDFSRYKTYAWLPSQSDINQESFNNDIFFENIRSAVNREMEARGFQLEPESADVLLSIDAQFERRSELVETGPGLSLSFGNFFGHPGFYSSIQPFYFYRFSPWGSSQYGQVEVQQATIVIDMYDSGSNKHIWRGGVEQRVEPSQLKRRLPKHISRIFRKFPVSKQ